MARRKRRSRATSPPEATLAVRAASAALVALCGLFAALVVRSGFARHAAGSFRQGVGGVVVLGAVLASVAFLVFVLAGWQWRLSPRGRFRVLVACYLSAFVAFCGLCWHDVGVATAGLPFAGSGSALRQLAERSAAVLTTLAALTAGVVAVAMVVRGERRRSGRGG